MAPMKGYNLWESRLASIVAPVALTRRGLSGSYSLPLYRSAIPLRRFAGVPERANP